MRAYCSLAVWIPFLVRSQSLRKSSACLLRGMSSVMCAGLQACVLLAAAIALSSAEQRMLLCQVAVTCMVLSPCPTHSMVSACPDAVPCVLTNHRFMLLHLAIPAHGAAFATLAQLSAMLQAIWPSGGVCMSPKHCLHCVSHATGVWHGTAADVRLLLPEACVQVSEGMCLLHTLCRR